MCTSPRLVAIPHLGKKLVPCNNCMECRYKHGREWTFRLSAELENWSSASFITLTYNNEHLPFMLVKRDFQLFMKRLRNYANFYFNGNRNVTYSIKYFACGEYGDNSWRPHFHFIAFGLPNNSITQALVCLAWSSHTFADFPNLKNTIDIYANDFRKSRDYRVCLSKGYGFITVDPCNIQTIKYTCGYVNKKIKSNPLVYEALKFIPPFQLSSQGLGKSYIDNNSNIDYMVENKSVPFNGFDISIPRYLRKKLQSDYGLVIEDLDKKAIKDNKDKFITIFGEELYEKYSYEDTLYKNEYSKGDSAYKTFKIHSKGELTPVGSVMLLEATEDITRQREYELKQRRKNIHRDKSEEVYCKNLELQKFKNYVNLRYKQITSDKIYYSNKLLFKKSMCREDVDFIENKIDYYNKLLNALEALK